MKGKLNKDLQLEKSDRYLLLVLNHVGFVSIAFFGLQTCVKDPCTFPKNFIILTPSYF